MTIVLNCLRVAPQLRPLQLQTSRHTTHHNPALGVRPLYARKPLPLCTATKGKFSSFEDMVSQEDLCLVDFYATWCGPCHMMSQEDASKTIKEVKFFKVDTEKYPSIASKYQVQALPTIVLFKNGKPVSRMEGAVQRASDLRQWIEQSVRAKV